MSGDTTVLRMENAGKFYESPNGAVHILRAVDLEIARGEFLMITGPSGSGKSTFLNLAALLDRATSGRVVFGGLDVSRLDERAVCDLRARRIGMVFQKFHLLPHRTALENVLFRRRYTGGADATARALARDAMSRMGLDGVLDRKARLLSAGEMQRVAIARAVAEPPELLVADEPTGNLDSSSALTVMECFKRLNADGMTVLMVTHNESLLPYATRHMVCRDGTMKEVG